LGEFQEGFSRKLNAKGFQFEGPVVDGHLEILRVENIVMAADEVEGAVELAVLKTIVSPQADVEADDVGHGAGGGEFGKGMESGDSVAHADAVEFPGEGVAGAGVGLEMIIGLMFHFSRKVRN